jgi:sulfatase modifying factor 1
MSLVSSFRMLPFLALLASCEKGEVTISDKEVPAGEKPPGMIWIEGGTFTMGTNEELAMANPVRSGAEETPEHRVIIEGFWMDETEVTNRQFKEFVDVTSYKTQAEIPFKQEDYPNARAEDLLPASFGFKKPDEDVDALKTSHWTWWQLIPNANWKQPEGPGSNIDERMDHPVVCLAYEDCAAYAKWAGKRLPTEAEWEYAARGGHENTLYTWGDELTPGGKWLANIWQGVFPNNNEEADGFWGTSPAKAFPPNDYGLYDMAGNVWEIVADPYKKDYYGESAKYNPKGPTDAADMEGTVGVKQRIIRGGSFLCSEGYCTGYRPAARQLTDDITASCHTGFRCAK